MNWQRWRDEFPITHHLSHFNHSGVAPISRRAAAAIERFAHEALIADRAVQKSWESRSEAARLSIGRLIGASAEEIAFVKNTSEGLSLIAAGLTWRQGDNVVLVENEYPANVYPWMALRRHGVEARFTPTRQGRVHVDDIATCVDERTRLVSVSFVDWSSGARTDLAALAEFCHRRDVLLCVDGIQGVGALQLDVEALGIDCMAVGGHKWLMAPEGCGFLYIARRVLGRIESVLHGWKSVTDNETYLPYHFDPPRGDAAKFEPGSPSHLAIHALGAAVDLLLEVGPKLIEQRVMQLTDHLADGLRRSSHEIISPWQDGARSGIVVFRPKQDAVQLADRLNAQRFVVRVRGGGIRVAPHFITLESDVDRLLKAIDAKGMA